jgi:cystathionine beta-synthase/cysteine synthase A
MMTEESEGFRLSKKLSSAGGCMEAAAAMCEMRDSDSNSESEYSSDDPVLSLIGNTPLVQYPKDLPGELRLKLEKTNPTGSMKDRIAYGMIRKLEERGELTGDETIVEASSGNTAGSVALVANRLGYDCVITTPVTTSSQKIGYVRALGGELITCPDVSSDNEKHYRRRAASVAEERDGVFLDQYHNQLNPEVHHDWTGPEVWQQAEGITHLVCPMGTGGTISGIAKHLKRVGDDVTIVGVDAEKSNISRVFHDKEPIEYDTSVEGLGKGEGTETMWFQYIDEVRSVTDETAFERAREASLEHGVVIGPSSGAALEVSERIVQEQPQASVLSIACDGAEQYFDTMFGDET